MIPKIIHYCWVGGKEKPESVLYCIASWKKYCPDYEIIEWNESNYDFFKNKYMRQAYDAKMWGFVPDYARLDIVYKYGGIYLDTDVELIKNLDNLLMQKAFMGFENTGDGEFFINCGHGFGAEPGNEIIRTARDIYQNIEFINEDGTYNLLPSPKYTTLTLKQFGVVQENKDQKLDNMMVYASDVLCPKNFRTGKIHKTGRTVAIHHFTASWLDEKVRKELVHNQKVKKILGNKVGSVFLVLESIKEKYTFYEMLRKIPNYMMEKVRHRAIYMMESLPYYKGLINAKLKKNGSGFPILLDTSIHSENCGDKIIMENCEMQLDGIIDCKNVKKIPTHRFLTQDEKEELSESSYKILCGTNILSGRMRSYGLWKLTSDVSMYKNTVLMGIGFDTDCVKFDFYTKKLMRTILSSEYLHSVRDKFSEDMLRKMGIKNVIYTGCPTMWNLTPELCKKIPCKKGKNVVCTLTDYDRDERLDQYMLNLLSELYENVWLWPQGKDDKKYFTQLEVNRKIKVLPYGLEEYDEVLKMQDLDYVGTRLHAGIRALSSLHRAIVIAIDNRARNIGKDTGLPIVERREIRNLLKVKICSDFQTEINIPASNIDRWKKSLNK